MALEPLINLVDELKRRMGRHSSLLRQSEWLTRYVLIDPMLRALGWDTEDPEGVRPEYPGAGGYADYALLRQENAVPVALVEAKKLGEVLEGGIGQALNYCNQQGISYMVVTDGDRWEMYEVFKAAPIAERCIMTFSISRDWSHRAALQALCLWRPNLSSPDLTEPPRPLGEVIAQPLASASPLGTRQREQGVGHRGGWIPIAQVSPAKGSKAPSAVRFPGGNEIQTKYWKEVLVEVARWLAQKGVLSPGRCPIGHGRERYIVHTTAIHPNGRTFIEPRPLHGGLFVETNTSARSAIQDTLFLLNHLSHSPDGIELRMS